ncbi:hypothetical protein C8R46DRAFT_1352583 [Mycena filopes]|nr:hypothetical protein C8R46DRAFT_1352583 [Mycena filopes]
MPPAPTSSQTSPPVPPAPPTPVRYAFYDKYHGVQRAYALGVPNSRLLTCTVAQFMHAVTLEHRKLCSENKCSLCPGSILVKSAWLVHIRDPSVEQPLPDKLEQDAAGGIRLMEAAKLLSEYINPNFPDGKTVIRVLLETTFEIKKDVMESPKKRPLAEVTEDSPHSGEPENKRPRPPEPTPEGLCIIPPHNPVAPINLPRPFFAFSSLSQQEGIVFVDRSLFIQALDVTLRQHLACVVTFPRSAGKTFIMAMLNAWYDSTISPELWEKLFLPLAIGPAIRKAQLTGKGLFWSARKHLCLAFNFADVHWDRADGSSVARAIESYCFAVLQQFVEKHHKELGFNTFERWEPSLTHRIEKIENTLLKQFHSNPAEQCTLFITIDHLDSPVIRLLATSGGSKSITTAITTMAAVITPLLALAGSRRMRRSKMLLNSTLFPFGGIPWSRLRNISFLPDVKGTYGMSLEAVDTLFTVLSRNRPPPAEGYPDLTLPRWREFLGEFTPPSAHPGDNPPKDIYTFDLVLRSGATIFEIESEHRELSSSPLVVKIAETCQFMLMDSNLRRNQPLNLAPIHEIWPYYLGKLWSREETLWAVLLWLGVLKVTDEGTHRPDRLWALATRSQTLAKEIFVHCPELPKDQPNESKREIQMRGLLERDPTHFADTMSERLAWKHHRDLYQMGEEALQATFDEYMGGDLKYKNHYFPQLGLLTNSKKQKEPRSAEGHLRDAPGEGRFGYPDFFFCRPALHGKRAMVGELKFLSLFGVLRAKYQTKEAFIHAMFEDPQCSFRERCKREGKRLLRLPLKDLEQVRYSRFDSEKKSWENVSVKDVLDAALKQVQWYVDAVTSGIADEGQPSEGVTRAETRVKVTKGSDEVFGVVFCGVGPRMITKLTETQSSKYHYTAQPNYRRLFDEDDYFKQ